jgi:hypothetical protein
MLLDFSASVISFESVENRPDAAMEEGKDDAVATKRNSQVTLRHRWMTGFFDSNNNSKQEQNQKEDSTIDFETSEEDLKYLELFSEDPRVDVKKEYDSDDSSKHNLRSEEMDTSDVRPATQPVKVTDDSLSDECDTSKCEKEQRFSKDAEERKVGWMSSFRMVFGRLPVASNKSDNEKSSQHSLTEDETTESNDTSERSSSIQTDEGDPSWTLKFGNMVSELDDSCEIEAFHLSDTIMNRFADDADETGSLHSVSMSDGL